MGKNDNSVTGITARKYIAENTSLPNKTIARLLREDHPELFTSVEHARSIVRHHRGNHGKNIRKQLQDKSLVRPNGKAGYFVIPAGLRQGRPPVEIKGPIKALILGDMHVPYHDEQAVEAALKKGVDEKCNAIYLNGDSIDFYKLSRWIKDPRQRSPRKEVDILKELLGEFAKYFPKRWYKMGNHEERWDTYLFQRAEDLIDFEEFELKSVLKCDELGYQFVYGKQRTQMGLLHVLHGHEFPRGISSPVNPARGVWLRLKHTAIVNHFHRSSQHAESNPLKKETSCTWSLGCLCYSSDTEVLTDRGFVPFPKLSDSDRVAEYDPDTKVIVYRQPVSKQRYDYSGKMFRFVAQRLDLLVTPEHKMLYEKDGAWFQSTAERVSTRHSTGIQNAGLFIGDNTSLSTDEARLLCWIVTEGCCETRKLTHRYSIYQKKPHRVKELRGVLMRMGIKSHHSEDTRTKVKRFRIGTQQSELIHSLLPDHKRLPRRLLNSRLNVLRAAYETLVAGDGHRKDNGTDYFATIYPGLAEDFQELCTKIGYSVRIVRYVAPTNYKPDGAVIYKCLVRKASYVTAKQCETVDYSGEVYDLTTATGFFVVRRNGHVCISGNCDLSPEYASLNEWNLGFAIVTAGASGEYQLENFLVERGKVYAI